MDIAILGTGNGGQACAADLSLAGHRVNLSKASTIPGTIEPIFNQGGINITGKAREGFAELNMVTAEVGEAIEGVDLIMVVTPAFTRTTCLATIAPYLKKGQTVLIMAGALESLEFAEKLQNVVLGDDLLLGETNTLPYSCRKTGPACVNATKVSEDFLFSAFPGRETHRLHAVINSLYAFSRPVSNILESLLNNTNPVVHPASIIMNAGWIEYSKGDFQLYREGITPSISRVINDVDQERLSILEAFGLEQTPLFGEGRKAMHDQFASFSAFKAPSSLKHRYITEDVPFGLVLFASIARIVNVETPRMNALITLASTLNNVNYFKTGKTAEKLGISGLTAEQINRFLSEGSLSNERSVRI